MSESIGLEERIGSIAGRNNLEDIKEIGEGLAIATQVMKIGDDVVHKGRLLIEEVAFKSADELEKARAAIPVKRNLMRGFGSSSTWISEFDYEAERGYFMHPVSGVLLSDFLNGVNKASPPEYNYDMFRFLGDKIEQTKKYFKEEIASARERYKSVKKGALRNARMFAESLAIMFKVVPKALQLPYNIGKEDRYKLVMWLAEEVRKRHKNRIGEEDAPIYQRNISTKTAVIQDNFKLRLLSNYHGENSGAINESVPAIILSNDPDVKGVFTFGEYTKDIFPLASIAYEVITGKKIDIRDKGDWLFRLDRNSKYKYEDLSGWNPVRWYRYMRSVMDESDYPNIRRLTRATGSWLRQIPFLRKFTDRWMPTKKSRFLRDILDMEHNERRYGFSAGINKGSTRKVNVDIDQFASEFYVKDPEDRKRLEEFVEERTNVFSDKRRGFERENGENILLSATRAIYQHKGLRMLARAAGIAGLIAAAGGSVGYLGIKYGPELSKRFENKAGIEQVVSGEHKPAAEQAAKLDSNIYLDTNKSESVSLESKTDTTDKAKEAEIKEAAKSETKTSEKSRISKPANQLPYNIDYKKSGNIPVYRIMMGAPYNLRAHFRDPEGKPIKISGFANINDVLSIDEKGIIRTKDGVSRDAVRAAKPYKVRVNFSDGYNNSTQEMFIRVVVPGPYLKREEEGIFVIRNMEKMHTLKDVYYGNHTLGHIVKEGDEIYGITYNNGKYEALSLYECQRDYGSSKAGLFYRTKFGDRYRRVYIGRDGDYISFKSERAKAFAEKLNRGGK